MAYTRLAHYNADRQSPNEPVAVCVLLNFHAPFTTTNVIRIYEADPGLFFHGTIHGLMPGKHGFHIHEFGDLTEGCKSLCAHFNPYEKEHGGPNSRIRHLGDLGNITADENKIAHVAIHDRTLRLKGPHGILGRSIVVHADEDDLGLGGHPLSKTTGNAGKRILCGVIGYASRKCS